MCRDRESDIAYEILGYLAEHPEAQDTLEGIVEWWLLERRIKTRTQEVREALATLTADRLVVERQGKDTRTHYRINRSKKKEIQSILERRAK